MIDYSSLLFCILFLGCVFIIVIDSLAIQYPRFNKFLDWLMCALIGDSHK